MGRFDALTQVEEPKKPDQPTAVSPTPPEQISQPSKNLSVIEKKPAKRSPTPDGVEKPEKYTTRLEPSLVKKLQFHAVQNDMKDYEVVRIALQQYFDRNK
jgi:hypothetical protein